MKLTVAATALLGGAAGGAETVCGADGGGENNKIDKNSYAK